MTVAPVVVKPDKDSKKALVIEISICDDKTNGIAPNEARTVQNKTTIKKPSRSRNSFL